MNLFCLCEQEFDSPFQLIFSFLYFYYLKVSWWAKVAFPFCLAWFCGGFELVPEVFFGFLLLFISSFEHISGSFKCKRGCYSWRVVCKRESYHLKFRATDRNQNACPFLVSIWLLSWGNPLNHGLNKFEDCLTEFLFLDFWVKYFQSQVTCFAFTSKENYASQKSRKHFHLLEV